MAELPNPLSAFGPLQPPQLPRGQANVNVRLVDKIQEPARSEIGAGGVMEQAANELDTINTLKAEDAFNQLRQKQLELTTGQDGFANVRGGDAIDPKFYPGAVSRFADAQREVGDGLTNDRQRFLFDQRSKVAELQYKEQLLAHVHQENNTFQAQTNQAVISTEVQSIAANYRDPKAIGLSNVRIAAAIDRESERLGWSKEEKSLATQKATDAAWSGRLSAQLLDDPVGALKSFNEAGRDEMSKPLAEQMFLKLKSAALPVDAKNAATDIINGKGMQHLTDQLASGGQSAVDQAIAQGAAAAPSGSVNPPGPGAAGLPPSGTKYDIKAGFMGWVQQAEAIAQKQHPDDPVYRDLLVSNVKSHMNTLITAQDGLARQAHASLMSAATPQPGKPAPLVLDQLLTSPQLRQAWLDDPQGQRGVLALLDHNARQANGLPIRTNPLTFESVWNRINLSDDNPNKIRQPGQLAPYLAHGINRTDYDWFKQRIDENQTPEGQRLSEVRKMFLEQAKAQFDSSTMMFHDAKGKSDNYRFWYYATDQERQARAGNKDPFQLYNPQSPEYLGNKIPAFKRTLEQRIQDMTDDISAGQSAAVTPTQPAPQAAAAPGAAGAITATNPKTGERRIHQDGKWQPLK
jgi:hypothetical protein